MAQQVNVLVRLNHKLSCFRGIDDQLLAQVQEHVSERYGLFPSEDELFCNERPLSTCENVYDSILIDVRPPLLGGKGGFGSLLRALGNKRSHKETDNIDACRGLDGRRLRHVNDEKKLKEWLAQEEERRQEKEDKRKAKLERMTAVPKHTFDHHSFTLDLEDTKTSIGDAVKEAMASGPAAPAAVPAARPIKKSAAFQDEWDDEDLSSSDDDNDNDADKSALVSNGETASKRAKTTISSSKDQAASHSS
eukprot:TRINITY_DN6303_c0_g1_i1.p1 TRINITY_DN6303_c0_g1~~TRINITY_DN6303_c0_g1_i1.p1  ORF type:complete len:249 (+),score=35.50 TRINITY_DN6303_c0_g1_i1:201-947(+)